MLTILRLTDEETTEENTLFDVDIIKFHLEYKHDNGKVVVITEADLKKYFSIYLIGMNEENE